MSNITVIRLHSSLQTRYVLTRPAGQRHQYWVVARRCFHHVWRCSRQSRWRRWLLRFRADDDSVTGTRICDLLDQLVSDLSTNSAPMVRPAVILARPTRASTKSRAAFWLGQLAGHVFENRGQPCSAPLIAGRIPLFAVFASPGCDMSNRLLDHMAYSSTTPCYGR